MGPRQRKHAILHGPHGPSRCTLDPLGVIAAMRITEGRFPEHLAANALIIRTSVLLGVLLNPVYVTSKSDTI